jgi:hypothetical protein
MAAITPTNVRLSKSGNHWVVTGSVVVPDTNANEFRVGKSCLWCHVENTTDDDTTYRVDKNVEDDFSTASAGLVAIQSSAADTFDFTAGVLL